MKLQAPPNSLHSNTQKKNKKLASKLLEPHTSEYFTAYIKGKDKEKQLIQSKGAKIVKDQAQESGGAKPSAKEIEVI